MRRNTQPSGVLSLGGGGQTAQSQGGEREGTACPAPASLSHAPRGGCPALTPPRPALATPPRGVRPARPAPPCSCATSQIAPRSCRWRGAHRAPAGCRFPRPPPRVGPGRALPPAAPQPTQARRLPPRICASPGPPPAAPGLSPPLPRALPALAAIQARSTRPVPSCSLCLDTGPTQRASRR